MKPQLMVHKYKNGSMVGGQNTIQVVMTEDKILFRISRKLEVFLHLVTLLFCWVFSCL